MNDFNRNISGLPPEQQAIRDRCFHPSGSFVEFPIEDLEKSIPERFEKIVRLFPDRIAVKAGSHLVTYSEINAIANRVADAILAQQGNRAKPVGLLFEKGAPLVAAMLGVLKASRFFVLLDPSLPTSRIAYILEDSRAELVVTNGSNVLLAREVTSSRCPLMEFESIDCAIPAENLRQPVSPKSFAFISYTSGSTGQPKGVAQNHRNMLYQVMLRTNSYHICEHDRLSLLASGTSNAINYTFHALLNGAALFSFDVKKEGVTRLAGWLSHERISICGISSPLFRNLADVLTGEEKFTDLRLIQVGSDTIYKSDVDSFKKYFSPDCVLATGVSSSETGLMSEYLIDSKTCIDGSGVPVGYPIDGKEILLLDDAGKEIGFNEIGEIVVRSCYISPGYWRKPDLTKTKFIPDPKGGEERLYLTGDLGLMFPDGCLFHKGRKDFRVKVRGYGVELAEVERAMLSHPAVREAVVMARENESGETYLVAYFTSASQPGPTVSELRGFLTKTLADFMIPSAFVSLAHLPLTTNGKVDRAALPSPGSTRPELSIAYSAPTNEREAQLSRIWCDVLGLGPVGIHDNFFDLGGHSLAATRILTRVLRTFQVSLRLTELFQTPTIAGLAGQIAEHPRIKNGQANSDPIRQHRRIETCPLSFTQQRLWFLHQLEPESCAYNLLFATRLTGSLDVRALEQSLEKVVERHDVLRTILINDNGNAQQVVLPSAALELKLVDLRQGANGTPPESQVSALAAEFGQIPFDLARGPLLRVELLRLGENQFVLLHGVHHIIYDAWSAGIFARELSSFYNAIVKGEMPEIQPLSIQYGDFAVWQHERFQQSGRQDELEYWKRQLADLTALELPTDRPRPPIQTHRGGKKSFILEESLTAALKKLSRDENTTLFMTLLAAFQTLLHRYTSQDDIAVGTAVDGRPQRETEDVIGFFLNTLVLRTRFSGDPSFRKLLERAREVCLGAFEHRNLPFDKLVEALQPERDLSRNPLFSVAFVLQNTPASTWQLSGVAAQKWELESAVAQFDLHIFMEEEGQTLKGTAIFNSDLFNAETISRLLGNFNVLLEGIVAAPEQRVSELPLLTEAERHQLLVEWNDTKRDYSKDKCIHELFEIQVEKTPDAVALVFEDQQLTYRELDQKANQTARYLRHQGVQPDTVVALLMERSLEMVVGILGVLKAGGAYLPIDPDLPAERLRFLLEDAQVRLLLTQDKFRSALAHFAGHIICLDSDWHKLLDQSHENPQHHVMGNHAAYVIYTSGSTGNPKGVVNVHDGLRNRIQWMQETYRLTSADRVLQKTPFTFDVSVWEFLWPLISGARLVVARPGGHQDGSFLVQLIQLQQITTLHFVPSMLGVFLQESGVENCTSLRKVFCSGEALSHDLQQRFFERSTATLHNLYGPTEASIDVTAWECRNGSDLTVVPIGRPIANTQIHILDSNLQPVPIGVSGEIHISGLGLARGYLNRPELTQEKFIANPFSTDPGPRLYKTGDLARYLPDGNIEFLGRIDNQVKIRGFRIELGEIEAVLAQHPSIQQAVVLAREESPGDKRLVAYVVPDRKTTATATGLRSFLNEKLPDYMMPSAFVFMDAFPLSPNGKVDRKALPVPDQIRPELQESFVASRTPVEELLAGIWTEVLKLEQVGIHDNFFDLGGHSLLAAQLVSRIRDAFRIGLPLRRLFEGPTVAGLAKHIELARQETAGIRALPIVPEVIAGECPLSFAQERFWFLEQLEPNNLAYHVTYGFRLIGPLNSEALEKALSELVRRHETLRTTFHVRDGKPVQVISEQRPSPLKTIDLRQHPPANREAEVQGIIERERRRGFDLSRDLLLRATLLQLGTHEHVLILNSHHIAWDHWCIEILFRELAVLYRAYLAGKPSPLPDPTIQYRHYALWQRKVFDHAELQNHLSYWTERLHGAPWSLNLPTDHPRKPLVNRRGGRQSLVLPKRLTADLEALSRRSGVTFFMTFLAAYQTLLYRMTGQDDIVVGTPIAGRDRSETEGLIGLFLNSLALRTDFSGNPTFLDLLKRVRDVALGACDHQDLPFEKLVEELQPDRDLTQTPIFQVFINLYNFKEASFQLDQLRVERLTASETAPQFDIEFSIREHDDGTHLTFVYDSDLFDASTITRTLSHFETLLEGIVVKPDQRISDFPLLTEAERHQLLVEWNDTRRDYPKEKCLHELFEAQVERSPDAIAVVFEDQQLTYRELNGRANQLAHYLRKLGVGPETLVGISMERSLEMVLAILGILKAGGAYVPLDPSYPRERLAFVLEDAQTRVLFTQEKFLSSIDHRNVVCLDRDWHEIAQEKVKTPQHQATPDNLAYVIYTSGSSGTPKGVMIPHRGLVNYLSWATLAYEVAAGQGAPVHSPIGFDLTITSLFTPLLAGRRVEFPSEDQGVEALSSLLRRESDYSLIKLTPAHLELLGQELPADKLAHCARALVIGGEALTFEKLAVWSKHAPATRLINEYGPTETVVGCCVYEVAPGNFSTGPVPIGRPIANTQVYILDQYLAPVPIGVVGELHIGGEGLARGYLNRPEATAEKFIANPFSADLTSRLYKTGDLARHLPDGNIEFLGRIDNQVKIRGFRIELGEIEAVLSQHPRVREAVVLAHEDSTGDRRLVANVATALGSAPSANELRSFLKEKLPEYMVPSAFVFLDSLPLTPNGKVDCRALPVPDPSRPELGKTYTGPRTPTEEVIAEIWAKVLKLEKIGIHDNFFELGGHSLLATQVVSRIREVFQIDISLRALFEKPTIEELAIAIMHRNGERITETELSGMLDDLESLSKDEVKQRLARD